MSARKVLMGLAVLIVLVGAAVALWDSPWLKLRTVQVVGNTRTATAQVVGVAALTPGTRLTAISSRVVASRVETLPWVATATVTHVLPSTIRIAVSERVPAVVVQAPDRQYLVDRSGAVLAAGSGGYPPIAGLPLGVVVPGSRITVPAFSAAVAVLESLAPPVRGQLAVINATAADLISLGLTNGTTILYGTAEDLSRKNADVASLLATGRTYLSINVQAPDHPAAIAR